MHFDDRVAASLANDADMKPNVDTPLMRFTASSLVYGHAIYNKRGGASWFTAIPTGLRISQPWSVTAHFSRLAIYLANQLAIRSYPIRHSSIVAT